MECVWLQKLYNSGIQMVDNGSYLDPGLVQSGPLDIIAQFYSFSRLK